MATRAPLVIVNGRVSQLPAGDTISGVGTTTKLVTNDNASPIVIGEPVYSSAADHVDLADGTNVNKSEVVGLVSDVSIAAGVTGNIQTGGILSATTGQWDAITGGSGGLTVGSVYYLDVATPGHLTLTPPVTLTDWLVRIGRALSTTELEIGIEPPIGL